MSGRPKIGAEWRPVRFEHRTPTEYRALRPEMGADAERLQRALLPRARRSLLPELFLALRMGAAGLVGWVGWELLAVWWGAK